MIARGWPVGIVLESPLADMVHGEALAEVRATIHETVWLPKLASGRRVSGHALEGEPDEDDDPEAPGYGEPTPAERPQSCVPDTIAPKRPQSCDPFHAVCEPSP